MQLIQATKALNTHGCLKVFKQGLPGAQVQMFVS